MTVAMIIRIMIMMIMASALPRQIDWGRLTLFEGGFKYYMPDAQQTMTTRITVTMMMMVGIQLFQAASVPSPQ